MRRVLTLACAAALAVTALGPAPSNGSAPDPGDGEALVRADADGPVRIRHENGTATFIGAGIGTEIDHPNVGRATPVARAARAHVERYGAALGTDRAGTVLRQRMVTPAASGQHVVRYQQEVDGLPVLGGDLVVALDSDHDLASMSAHISTARDVPAARVSEAAARRTAEELVRRSGNGGPAVATGAGRWLFDPATAGSTGSARGTWRFEVRTGAAVRRLVLVDDLTGAVLLDRDLVQTADRAVCDQKNVSLGVPPPCQSGFARTETSGPSAVADVNLAFDHTGAASEFYDIIGGIDLTALLGSATPAGKKLASTVRVCESGSPCPYANAYWDGVGVFYGQGFAAADDVVGHELTHGVIERTSGLLYWDEPGAINESLADIIGEIIDHRYPTSGDSVADWRLGEDLPGGALRDAADPTTAGQPDRMTSELWEADPLYEDGGGVHSNSGVGNKAFHLISQGGTFNGQTVVGIDGDDPQLTKSANLWLQVIASINAFTEYDDLATVLGQACVALVDAGTLAPSDCTSVQRAVAATEMATAPLADPVADPSRACAAGTVKRTLAESEGGSGAGFMVTSSGWGRTPGTEVNAAYGVNAFSGDSAWVAADPPSTTTRTASFAQAVGLPEGQPSYLAFRHWYLLDFENSGGQLRYYDGGTVAVDDPFDSAGAFDLSGEPWLNGPTRVLQSPNAGSKAFSGSSRGWTGSIVDLSAHAGKDVAPEFTMRTDSSIGMVGWYLDDIEVYTCDPQLTSSSSPVLSGTARVSGVLRTSTGTWSHTSATGLSVRFQWLRNGAPIPGADRAVYVVSPADVGKRVAARVVASYRSQQVSRQTLPSAVVPRCKVDVFAHAIQGVGRVGRRLRAGDLVARPAAATYRFQWLRDGRAIRGATGRSYLLVRSDRGHAVRLLVRGVLAGCATGQEYSVNTIRVR